MPRLLLTIAAALALSSQGCTSSCDGVSDAPIAFLAGITNAAGTEYQTSPWDGRYLSFPANRRYDLVHGLYTTPAHVSTYLGFVEIPLGAEGSVAESAGNMVLIEEVNDELVGVRNDTCQHFYLRVVASVAAGAPAPSGQGGAGGDGGGMGGSAGVP
jgi:hypothetical protein